MQQRILTYKNSRVCSYRFGSGSTIVICFHGYGEEGAVYSFLGKYPGHQYSFYAIDLPFHGRTEWNEGLDFDVADLEEIIALMLAQDGFSWKQELPAYLLGFSLGGRVALSLYEERPGQIQKLVLLAPDGLKVNFWYWLATQTWLGSRLFSNTMKYPRWFFSFLKVLNRAGLVNSSIYKFVHYYIDNPAARQQLFSRWMSLRKLRPDLKKVKRNIRQFETPVRLVYGKYDRIILPARGNKFRSGIEAHCSIAVINAGHQVLHEKHVEEIMKYLNE